MSRMSPTIGRSWKDSYSDLDQQYETEHQSPQEIQMAKETEAVERTSQSEKTTIGSLSKGDFNILLLLYRVLREHEVADGIRVRSQAITKVTPEVYSPKPNSIEARVHSIISASGQNGVHINQVLASIERDGFQLSSQHHKYSQVYSVIRRNSYMYDKTARATFRLKDGFRRNVQRPENVALEVYKSVDAHIPSIRELSWFFLDKYKQTKNKDLTPKQLHRALRRKGYKCSLEYVKKVLRNGRSEEEQKQIAASCNLLKSG